MPTLNQLVKKERKKRRYKNRRRDLHKCPQKKAVCVRVFSMTPRKPNSALRKVAWVAVNKTKKCLTLAQKAMPLKKVHAYIPGMGHTLQKFGVVLLRGGRVKDLPGFKYTIIRGKFDLKPIYWRRQGRSKYGNRFEKLGADKKYKKFRYW